jgi:hypothetical protein
MTCDLRVNTEKKPRFTKAITNIRKKLTVKKMDLQAEDGATRAFIP